MNNYAFIDSQNLYLGTKKLGWNLDYKKLRIFLKDKFFITKAFIFIGYISKNKKLYKFLTETGFILIFKPTIKFKSKGKFIK